MGWFDSAHPEHEGYLVGLVHDKERGLVESEHMRQLAYPHDDHERHDVVKLQGACSCGWRSPRFTAPYGTKWYPHTVELPDFADEHVRAVVLKLWREHLRHPDLWEAYLAHRARRTA